MALYTPDPQLRKAENLIKNLRENPNEESILILYYLSYKETVILKQREKLKKYREWFETLNQFLPNKNPVFK